MPFIEIVKTVLLAILEGITEWLPISSTGHLILLGDRLNLACSEAFWGMFLYVIQLGAICAVIVLYFNRLNPFAPSKSREEKKSTWQLWFRIIVAVIPSAVIGLLISDWVDEHFENSVTVAVMLILYGIIYIVVEKCFTQKRFVTAENGIEKQAPQTARELSYKQALVIGAFQVLSIIPGTSRSGSTILGGMAVGASRVAAAEFSFFLAIPTMVGVSLLKVLDFFMDGNTVAPNEWVILLIGCVVAFLVSLAVIRALVGFVRRHTFVPFAIYRIALGILVLLFFFLR